MLKYVIIIMKGVLAMAEFHLCPKFEAAFELIGKRWTGLIIRVLLPGPKRFKEFIEMIPNVSGKVLIERLKELESAGIISRKVYPEMPVRVEYFLTEKGMDLLPVLDELQTWAEKWVHIEEQCKLAKPAE
jgi:DNA-binding HxlR family transcriptional regulator